MAEENNTATTVLPVIEKKKKSRQYLEHIFIVKKP